MAAKKTKGKGKKLQKPLPKRNARITTRRAMYDNQLVGMSPIGHVLNSGY